METSRETEVFQSREAYEEALRQRAVLPAGFRAGMVPLEFFPEERRVESPLPMNLSVIELEEPTESFAGVFTRNAFPGAPVLLGRERLKAAATRGVLINNKIANVGSADGRERAETLLRSWAEGSGVSGGEYFGASTGIIGWGLPMKAMTEALPSLRESLQSESLFPVARGIMTTDAFPKVRRCAVGPGSIVGVAKGAGMIEPNMATMLVYLLTDLRVDRDFLRETLAWAVEETFNAISIDSDQSTSDMVLAFASHQIDLEAAVQQAGPGGPGGPGGPDGTCGSSEKNGSPREFFRQALLGVCRDLAEDIVRNGEGTRHVLEVRVSGAPSREVARAAAKGVINSPLVKTAVFGNDPNVGRLIGALGDCLGNRAARGEESVSLEKLRLRLEGEEIFARGGFLLDPEKEERLSSSLREASFDNSMGFPPHRKKVILEADLGKGKAAALVLGSDLSYDYVRENADYRT